MHCTSKTTIIYVALWVKTNHPNALKYVDRTEDEKTISREYCRLSISPRNEFSIEDQTLNYRDDSEIRQVWRPLIRV